MSDDNSDSSRISRRSAIGKLVGGAALLTAGGYAHREAERELDFNPNGQPGVALREPNAVLVRKVNDLTPEQAKEALKGIAANVEVDFDLVRHQVESAAQQRGGQSR